MSSTQEGSSATTSNSKKEPASRRSLTLVEEAALLRALEDLDGQGLKADNGFKPGYLKQLEDSIRTILPSTDLRVNPHIVSKLSTWKKSYYSLSSILSRSGVGFNDRGNHMIECEHEQWEQIVKMDPNARGMRKKQWPYYEVWKEVFGTDRAEDMHEAFIDIQDDNQPRETEVEAPGEHEFSSETAPNGASNDVGSQSTIKDIPASKTARSKKNARFSSELQGVCELLADMNESTNVRLDNLTSKLGVDYDMSKARQETYAQLRDNPGLSIKNRLKLCELVAFKADRLDIWRALDREARVEYVELMVEELGLT